MSQALCCHIAKVTSFSRMDLQNLYESFTVAMDPHCGPSNVTFAQFVFEFGTYYMEETNLISNFLKLFTRKSTSEIE